MLYMLALAVSSFAQYEVISPLMNNAVVKQFLIDNPSNKQYVPSRDGRSQATDTLSLPFFDDFTLTAPFPDRRKWTDVYVFINNQFPIDPPSHGVATFDNLNWNGDPYTFINANNYGPSDTLTSQAIDMVNRVGGSKYKPSDSLFINFWYEPQGRDIDVLKNPLNLPQDTFLLQYYNKNSQWETVWRKPGRALPVHFHQANLAIKDSQFFHTGFRFRFISYSVQTGNANHWHLDYVNIEEGKHKRDTTQYDVTITDQESLLKDYASVPWSHFDKTMLRDSLFVTLRNLDTIAKNIKYEHAYRTTNFVAYPLGIPQSNLQLNLPKYSFQLNTLEAWDMNGVTVSNDSVVLQGLWTARNTTISGQIIPDKHPENDTLSYTQIFSNYIAYDDGNAESGYGLQAVPKGGKACQKFTLTKSDTLWGLSVFFTQCSTDVQNKTFRLAIWKSITKGSNKDELVKEIKLPGPVYHGGLNRFAYFELDTPIALKSGDFYIGWIQDKDFIVNVGQDVNYGKRWKYGPSKLIFYNVQSSWQSTTSDGAKGALMIRPYLGKKKDFPAYLSAQEPLLSRYEWPTITVFPNPTADILYLDAGKAADLRIYNLEGQLVASHKNTNSIDCSSLAAATYVVEISTDKYVLHKRFVVNR